MRALRVLIVDDEAMARVRLAALVRKMAEPRCEVAGEAASSAEALAWLSRHACDLLLLDIHMPGARGTELAQELRERDQPPAVVFVSAHPEHALRAFELEAVDYLSKPVRRERLQEALQRVAQRLGWRAEPVEDGVIVVAERGRLMRVPVAELLYLKAELKLVTLRTAERSVSVDDSLSELEPRLGARFIRVHRNAIVAREAMRELRELPAAPDDDDGGGWAVRVAPTDEWLAVSRRQLAAVREALRGQ